MGQEESEAGGKRRAETRRHRVGSAAEVWMRS